MLLISASYMHKFSFKIGYLYVLQIYIYFDNGVIELIIQIDFVFLL
ncbi:protein of unknown function [Clostridium beijerinckii]|nr:protein of unknown function [Clostridium beijerinckii]